MTHETGKSMARRGGDARFATRYFVGAAIDIGSGDDSLERYAYMFPGLTGVRPWDLADGDAMRLDGIADDSFDLVHSSHCLEHLADPWVAVGNWVRVCKPGGHLVIVVPDHGLYEQGYWPSRFNPDHKWSFSISGVAAHDRHVVLLHEVDMFHGTEVLKLELIDHGYRYGVPPHDQSLSVACEPAIEIVCRKRK